MVQFSKMDDSRLGAIFALVGFGFWVLYPFYWNQLRDVDAIEIVAHRVIWVIPVCILIMLLQKSVPEFFRVLRQPKLLILLACSTFFISVNWGLYIWSVSNDLILQASLGYFMNPLANVVAGLLIFQERLRPWQWVSVGLAAIGVVLSMIFAGIFPWVGVILAVSFAIYGSVRKLVPVDAVTGLCVETIILFPIAVGYLFWLASVGGLGFTNFGLKVDMFLIGAGLVTALPLVAYVAASKRLPISTLGMLFYLVPSGLFIVATQAYDEVVTDGDMITFAFIWASLIIFSVERRNHARRNRVEVI